ncbi:MucR family transcriptional regulator [Gluconacetobacter azotocaptans]|uniref:MucR family transcriptional regulator n=1 Tax=Gluconacetobacter azotocaptans TaxID=142834 RepID=UPI0019565860|nr:MucR family transcriptional regulator [Gluconacetobacter azotocaptans]
MSSDDTIFLAHLNAVTQIVTAHLASTKVETDQLPELVSRIYASLPGGVSATTRPIPPSLPKPAGDRETKAHRPQEGEGHPATQTAHTTAPASAKEDEAMRRKPAVPIQKSVFPDYVVCLEDGKKLKSLKRHLMSAFGMTIAEYKEKWNLPEEYPTVAPNYAEMRRNVAKSIGLGRRSSPDEEHAGTRSASPLVVPATSDEAPGDTKRGPRRRKTNELSLVQSIS